jgi:Flp pilus assembly protein TadB
VETYRRRNKKGSITIVRKGKSKSESQYNPYLIAAGVGLLGASVLGARSAIKQSDRAMDKAYKAATKELTENTDNFISSHRSQLQNSFKNLGI